MRYRLRCDLAFTDEYTARLAYKYLQARLATVQPLVRVDDSASELDPRIVEGGALQLELCRHDEGGPCEVLDEIKV